MIARHFLIALAPCIGVVACFPPSRAAVGLQPLRAGPTSCVSLPSSDSTVYDTTQISEQPYPRSAPEVSYPREALRRRIHGEVAVTAIVNVDGSIDQSSVTVSKSV